MSSRQTLYRTIISVVVLVLLIFVLIPQVDALWRSLVIVRQAAVLPVLIAIFMTCMTYVLLMELYWLMAKHPLERKSVGLVQTATALTSRVVPIGIGSMGLNVLFMRRRKHSLAEALAVVATVNSINLMAHLTILALVATTAPLPGSFNAHISANAVYWILLAAAAIVIALAVSTRIRRAIGKGLNGIISTFAHYRRRPRDLLKAYGLSLALSTVYVLTLMAAGQALGVTLPFGNFFVIYTFSLLTGIATPTPGGLVGVEAGLTGGLITFGIAADTALAVALLYRLITYWLPLLPGFIAFRIVQHKYF